MGAGATRANVQSVFALLTLLLIAALGLVSPAGCAGCRLDTHGGQALHVIFEHVHPEAPAEGDDLAAGPTDPAEVHAAVPLLTAGPMSLVGQVLPGAAMAPVAREPDRILRAMAHSPPIAPALSPLDPPPRPA